MWFSKAKEGAAESEAPSAGARSAARPKVRRRATATSHSDWGEKYIAGVPARIMRPRFYADACSFVRHCLRRPAYVSSIRCAYSLTAGKGHCPFEPRKGKRQERQ